MADIGGLAIVECAGGGPPGGRTCAGGWEGRGGPGCETGESLPRTFLAVVAPAIVEDDEIGIGVGADETGVGGACCNEGWG
jgi:hypothetical protein